jgi:hypothetical protein
MTATSSRSTPPTVPHAFETGLFPGESCDSSAPLWGYPESFGTEWHVLAACCCEVSGTWFSWPLRALPLVPFVHTLNTLRLTFTLWHVTSVPCQFDRMTLLQWSSLNTVFSGNAAAHFFCRI